jgi:hypothetical protein
MLAAVARAAGGRVRPESLGWPVGENRYEVELAPQASHWLGSSVLQPAAGHDHDRRKRRTDRKPGQAGARIRYAAGRASRSVSSWMSTAIFVRAAEYCRL